MSQESEIEAEIVKFLNNGIKNIKELSAEELIQDAAINPFLVKALNIKDFDSLARLYVYQRIGRSLVTSFGYTMENMIRILVGGEKPQWWDVKKTLRGRTYYLSVKSGPRDMDKDQVVHFARMAKDLVAGEPNAIPIIAMGYGSKPLGVIKRTLENEGLDVDRNTLTGKRLYETITGQPGFHKTLLELVNKVGIRVLGGKEIVRVIEDKIDEIAAEFKRIYSSGNLDALLMDTF